VEEQLFKDREMARTATEEELARLLFHADAEVLVALVGNPALDETQLCLMLERIGDAHPIGAAVVEHID